MKCAFQEESHASQEELYRFFFMGYFLNAGKTHHPKYFNNVSNNSIIYDDALSNKNKIFKAIEL
jgi:hypothetical protein